MKTPIHRIKRQREQGSVRLADVQHIVVALENGDTATFDPTAETHIPTDQREQYSASLSAPAQFAFWAYQTERALSSVRRLERELAHKEGECSLIYREWYKKERETYTEDMIRSRISVDAQVDELRQQLINMQGVYGVLRAMRDAVEHRLYVLRKITGIDGNKVHSTGGVPHRTET